MNLEGRALRKGSEGRAFRGRAFREGLLGKGF